MVAPINSGTFAYNGVAWTSLYRCKVQCKPVKDSAGRALVAREYLLDVEGRLGATPGSTTDATLTTMRRLLEAPAGALTFSAKGFGTLNVNVAGGQLWDMSYGPWPEVLNWDPVGNDQACLVRWRCVTQVPCEENPSPTGIIEYCFDMARDVDKDGYTTRTISGHLTIEATRRTPGSRALPDNADAYLDKVIPDCPLGFERTQKTQLSEDKRTIRFTFTDTQIPAPLPPGVTTADVRHKVRWEVSKNGAPPMSSTISGTIVLPVGTPKSQIWDKILMIMRSRWPVGGSAGNTPFATNLVGKTTRQTWLLSSIEIDDDVFGRGTSFSASATVLGDAATPQSILSSGGLWQAIPGTTFVAMRNSLFAAKGSGKPWAPRGMAGLTFQNSDDAIVDLCGRQDPPILKDKPSYKSLLKGKRPPSRQPGEVDPDTSWLQYRLEVRQIETDRVVRHKPLGGNPPRVQEPLTGFVTRTKGRPALSGFITQTGRPGPVGTTTSGAGGGNGPESTTAQTAGVTSTTPDLVQRVGSPSYRLRLQGSAVRVGYPIPTPRLSSLSGIPVTQIDQDVSQTKIGSIGGQPIYRARWRVDYLVPEQTQAELPLPVNPAVE